ncbi:MAG TPA: nitroreductase family protein [Opitutaceae bacterium]|nr:nitroreductase family protein [Opitutaceae bacterium]
MDLHEAIRARRTVRDFQKRPIAPATLERIIDAGLHAPTNDHLRSWEFVVIDEPARRLEVLAKVRKSWTPAAVDRWLDSWHSSDALQRAMYLDGVPKQHRMLLEAGALVLPCFRQVSPLLEPESQSALNGFASIWCCIENMLLAAAAEGVFGVTRIPFATESTHLKRLLGVPGDYEIACYLALGYPAPGATAPRQHLPTAKARLHRERW